MHVTPPATCDGALASCLVQALLSLSRGLRRVFGFQGASVVLGGWLLVVDQLADGLFDQVIDGDAQSASD